MVQTPCKGLKKELYTVLSQGLLGGIQGVLTPWLICNHIYIYIRTHNLSLYIYVDTYVFMCKPILVPTPSTPAEPEKQTDAKPLRKTGFVQ